MIDKAGIIILSGGKNSRMGFKVKAFLKLGDECFIEKILKRVDNYDEIVISCNDLELYDKYSDRCTLVSDEIKDIGPLGGIYSSLKKLRGDRAVIIAADMPFVKKETIDTMAKIDFKGDALIPIVNGKEEPLFGVYKKSSILQIEKMIEEKNYKLKNLLKVLNVTYILINDEISTININTPAQYEESIKAMEDYPTVINVVAKCSNVGKTTVVEGIIRELTSRGYSVSTIKHDVHGFDIDKEGKDTWKHRMAGASTVSISSKERFAMIKEVTKEFTVEEIINMNRDSDFIIVEGYKKSSLRKIEVIRKEISEEVITPKDKLIAIASNFDVNIEGIECVDIHDYKRLSDIIEGERIRRR